jgi:hypothetical protein
VMSFFSLLYSHTPRREDVDKLRWNLNRNSSFESRSFYHASRAPREVLFPWKSIWAVKDPRRIAFFVWTTDWDRILTCDNLMKWGHVMAGWYCMCRSAGETVDHPFLYCRVVRELWSFVFRSFGIDWVLLN